MIDARQKLRSILRKKKQTNHKQLGRLNIQQMPVADLIAADYNPRMIDEATLDGLQSSIERFGLVEPIVWNKRTNTIVGGHQRLKVLQRRGDEATDVAVVDLDEVDERTLNLTLNNPHLQGIFDQERLEVLIKDLEQSLPELDFGELRLRDLHGEFVFADPGTTPTLDELEQQYGKPNHDDLWPVIRLKVSPETKARFEEAYSGFEGDDDESKLNLLLDRLDE